MGNKRIHIRPIHRKTTPGNIENNPINSEKEEHLDYQREASAERIHLVLLVEVHDFPGLPLFIFLIFHL